jgi:hypothetical protein
MLSLTAAPFVRRGPHVPGIEPERLVRLTVDEYAAIATAGVIAEGTPIELLNGVMRWKDRAAKGESIMTVGKRHAIIVNQLQRLLTIILQNARCFVQVQSPVSLSPIDEPEPDICVVSGTPGDERHRHPTPDELVLLVEVADSSLDYDRGEKLEAYAVAGVREYWIVNLIDDHVEVYQRPDPASGEYGHHADFSKGETLSIVLPGDVSYSVDIDGFLT